MTTDVRESVQDFQGQSILNRKSNFRYR